MLEKMRLQADPTVFFPLGFASHSNGTPCSEWNEFDFESTINDVMDLGFE